MHITVNSTALAQELRLINQVVPSKANLPILTNVLIRAEEHLHLYATDLEVGFSTACRALVHQAGLVTLPAKRLLDLVEQFPGTDMQILVEGRHTRIVCDNFQGRLQAMPAEDFPSPHLPSGQTTTFAASALQAMVRRVRFAISEKSSTYVLKGALLTTTDTSVGLVATDGKRLSIATTSHAAGSNVQTILPIKTLDSLVTLFNGSELVFSQSEQHLFFHDGHRLLSSRMLVGQFPNYQRVVPQGNTKRISLARTDLAAALRRVGVVSDDAQAIFLSLQPSMLTISSSSAEFGEATERMMVEYTDEPLKVCVNGKFLLEFLEAAEGGVIVLAFKDNKTSLLVSDGQNFVNVIMLIRA